jgi:hypothetical protein
VTLPISATSYWKLQNSTWAKLPGASFSGNTVSFTLTDGGTGDSDSTSGQITDPGGPAIAALVALFTGWFTMIRDLGLIANARDSGSVTPHTLGEAPPPPKGTPDELTTMRDMVQKVIPAELVVPYTFLVTFVVGFATNGHHPDQLQGLRWGLFALLIVGTIYSTLHSTLIERDKHTAKHRWPALELAATTFAASLWGLSLPESPLLPSLHGDNRAIVPAAILIVGGVFLSYISSALRQPRSNVTKPLPTALRNAGLPKS